MIMIELYKFCAYHRVGNNKNTLPRVCNLHNSSVDGIFHEWHSTVDMLTQFGL